jgi:hypothetical protein
MNTKEIYKKETGLEVNGKTVGIETVISAHYVDWLEKQLILHDVSNCKTEPRLNKLETELDKLQKVHGEIINIYEVHNGCTGFKFKDGAAYRVKLERSFGKATLD